MKLETLHKFGICEPEVDLISRRLQEDRITLNELATELSSTPKTALCAATVVAAGIFGEPIANLAPNLLRSAESLLQNREDSIRQIQKRQSILKELSAIRMDLEQFALERAQRDRIATAG